MNIMDMIYTLCCGTEIHVTTVLLSSVLMAVHDYMVTVAVFLFQIMTKHEYHGHDLYFMLAELKSM